MATTERRREFLSNPPDRSYFEEKTSAGWRLVSMDWERDAPAAGSVPEIREELPFGVQVAEDGRGLTGNPGEKRALTRMMELIVKDRPLSEVAADLNLSGFRTRAGGAWTPVAVFEMIPRLIEVGPQIFKDPEYAARALPSGSAPRCR